MMKNKCKNIACRLASGLRKRGLNVAIPTQKSRNIHKNMC